MNDMMPKEQSDFIEKVRDKALESFNMDEHEAWDFAFRVWQGQNFLRECLSIKGSWEPHPNSREWDVCSVCGIGTKRREYGYREDYGREWMMEENYRYCPHCGAEMRGSME